MPPPSGRPRAAAAPAGETSTSAAAAPASSKRPTDGETAALGDFTGDGTEAAGTASGAAEISDSDTAVSAAGAFSDLERSTAPGAAAPMS